MVVENFTVYGYSKNVSEEEYSFWIKNDQIQVAKGTGFFGLLNLEFGQSNRHVSDSIGF